jgi:hypothetical protein
MAKKKPDLDELRRIALTGVLSNDALAERLVLKGGNALRLGHGVSQRASMDLDFSMAGDFDSPDEAKTSLFRGLTERFDTHGLVLIDPKFAAKPEKPPAEDPNWGGYQISFKLISRERHEALKSNPQKAIIEAMIVNPAGSNVMSIDISKHEFISTEETQTISVNGFECKIYSLRLIVAEKLRAIVQQMPDAPPESKQSRRPRDFFDIYTVCNGKEAEILGDNFLNLLNQVFLAKNTPIRLLADISKYRSWHEDAWPSVRDTAPSAGDDFGPYFDYVVNLANRYIPSGT